MPRDRDAEVRELFDEVDRLLESARDKFGLADAMIGRTAARRLHGDAVGLVSKAANKLMKINRLISEMST